MQVPFLTPQSSLLYGSCNVKNTEACLLRSPGPVLFPHLLPGLYYDLPNALGFDSNPCSCSPVGTLAGQVQEHAGTIPAPSACLVGSLPSPTTVGSRTKAAPQFQLLLSKCPTRIYTEHVLLLGGSPDLRSISPLSSLLIRYGHQ